MGRRTEADVSNASDPRAALGGSAAVSGGGESQFLSTPDCLPSPRIGLASVAISIEHVNRGSEVTCDQAMEFAR